MHYIVIFIAIGTLCFGVAWALSTYLSYLVAREVGRPKERGGNRASQRRWWLTGGMLVSLVVAPLLSWGVTGRLIFGLPVVIAVSALVPLWIRHSEKRKGIAVDRSSLTFFHALQGLLHVGLSLPSALFQLTQTMEAPFGLSLGKSLQGFESGKTLGECLERFRAKNIEGSTTMFLATLEMAYRQGLPASPLLERMLPLLEAEQEYQKRIESLSRTSLVQALIAFSLPWSLALVVHLFQPEVTSNFAASSAFLPVLAIALGMETVGAWLIWKISNFC